MKDRALQHRGETLRLAWSRDGSSKLMPYHTVSCSISGMNKKENEVAQGLAISFGHHRRLGAI